MNLLIPSDEQKNIINAVKNNNCCYVNAVAGSGKTTTVLNLAKEISTKEFILVTYNRRLKDEVRTKAELNNISNIKVHSYHSLNMRSYLEDNFKDEGIVSTMNNNPGIKENSYTDILVIDEVQDMTILYFRLIHKFILDQNNKIIILILGDQYQGVYEFKGTDYRFLTLAPDLYCDYNFIKLPLSESYRITKPIAWFVNNVMLGEDRIISNKEGIPVWYMKINIYESHVKLKEIIMNLIKNHEIKPDDIFVLVPSTKSKNHGYKFLENELSNDGIPCHVPNSDEDESDDKVINGKICFTTFHQAKGRERKIVIIYNFDSSYFQYYARDFPSNICSSALYVAATRASQMLILIEDTKSDPLPFLKKTTEQLKNYKEYITYYNYSINKDENENKNINVSRTSPTELTRFINQETLNYLLSLIKFECINLIEKDIKIPSRICTSSNSYEEISDINGLTIPSIYQFLTTGKHSLIEYIEKTKGSSKSRGISDKINKIKFPSNSINDFLYIGNVYRTLKEGVNFKLNQIPYELHNWLTTEMIEKCFNNMKKHINNQLTYEYPILYIYESKEYGRIEINGIIDGIDKNNIWEFKCVNELEIEHKLQLIIYAWMWIHKNEKEFKIFKLLNIRTGEVLKLNMSFEQINEVVNIILKHRYKHDDKESNEYFLDSCLESVKQLHSYKNIDDYLEISNEDQSDALNKMNLDMYIN